jgi:predicted transcriptional regulator
MTEFHRGALTDEIQAIAKESLGREITQTELRLYPYLDFCLKNSKHIEADKINKEEQSILIQLDDEGRIDYTLSGYLACSKSFYDFIQQILWLAYVKNKLQAQEEQ